MKALLRRTAVSLTNLVKRSTSLTTEQAYQEQHTGLTKGGLVNPQSGLGGSNDKSQSGFFQPTRVYWRGELEVLYNESWAAAKFINIPVDDALVRWREWDRTENEAAADTMMECDEKHKVRPRLARAMKAGRLYGTGLMVMVTKEADLATPLNVRQLRPGDLSNLLVVDRFDASVFTRDDDIHSPTCGEPLSYWINPSSGGGFHVHRSRVLRFDGRTALSSYGYTIYDKDWGVSEVIPVITSIMQDATAATGAAHMTQEASIPVLHVQGLRDAAVGQLQRGEATPEQIGAQVNSLKSIFRILMLAKGEEEFERIAVNFGGVDQLLDRFNRRLAAAADIPATRFWGMSPVGMNATGDSDMQNYSQKVASDREAKLPDPLRRLDAVLAADGGVAEPPPYTWPPLMEEPESTQVETARVRAEAVEVAIRTGVIDEDEGRDALDGSHVFGNLPGEAPGLPEPEPPPAPAGGDDA